MSIRYFDINEASGASAMSVTLGAAIASFGASAKAKLKNVAAAGEPEDQLRKPIEDLLKDVAELCGLPRNAVEAIGESTVSELKTRPDYAITVRNALAGFLENKAPGNWAEPRRFRDRHDKTQWEKLQSLPNLIYPYRKFDRGAKMNDVEKKNSCRYRLLTAF